MMSGEGDAGDGVRLKPWWRSVGFWVGAWGLGFLTWAWVDSYWHVAQVTFPVTREVPGYRVTTEGEEVTLRAGRVFVGRYVAVNPPAGMTVTREKPRVTYEARVAENPKQTWWGTVHRVEKGWSSVKTKPYVVKAIERQWWWFPFGVVIAAYVSVWAGVMVLWRRWMRGRVC